MKYAIILAHSTGVRLSIRGGKPRGRLSETTGGENQDLPVKRQKLLPRPYVSMNPFFQSRKNGFLFYGKKTGVAHG